MSSARDTPVLFLVFNRPEPTRRVLETIRRAAPRRLFVAVDGPRPGNERDASHCPQVLQLIREGVDWDCRIEYLRRETNLGCRAAVSSGISWFFEQVNEGIILEDDCLPSAEFFQFCSSLLEKHRDAQRVAHIGGFNCQLGKRRGTASYYFSRYFHIWGWATWRRAWRGYDVDMRDYPLFLREHGLENLFDRQSLRDYWKDIFDATAAGAVNTWDYQWVYRNLKDDRLAAVPNYNMVENIGYGTEATHTSGGKGATLAAESGIPTQIVHPQIVLPCREADEFTYRRHLRLDRFHDLKQAAKRLLGVRRRGAGWTSSFPPRP